MSCDFIQVFLRGVAQIAASLDAANLERMVDVLVEGRGRGGRLFLLGVGGSAASCAHAVNDFRKLAGMEAYTPTDNVAELTARANDDGWERIFADWLKGSRLQARDVVLVLSVGGGDLERKISLNLVEAVKYAKALGTPVLGIVGRAAGYTAQNADVCVVVPVAQPELLTPYTESFHSVICHLLVSHPRLKMAPTKY